VPLGILERGQRDSTRNRKKRKRTVSSDAGQGKKANTGKAGYVAALGDNWQSLEGAGMASQTFQIMRHKRWA